ncbi:Transcriptional regulatory protein LiaR [Planctomycetes bacterium CA13]|uniref:Transcriptional regulatory protein LiaR n=1 Tax=Novipirellula herctigrandis TaxID=2527986 RepID=A0A5C5Z7Z1_9BACT|nr:Transcriptional regulatory protein LiaR [Planctomycetes bacterium CA13]
MAESTSTAPLRLLLVDDHAVMRSGLANMLNARPEFEVVAGADDGESALRLYQEHLPDITLLDVVMPGMNGIECLRQLKQTYPDAKVLMLSSSDLDHDFHDAIQAGAGGFIAKTAKPSELVKAILLVAKGEKSIGDEVSARLEAYAHALQLTPRELEVLQLLRKGMSNRDIGFLLEITARTAKAHVAAIMVKLEAQDRAEAVARGFERGLLRP